MLLTNECW